MRLRLLKWVKKLLLKTPFEGRRRLPAAVLEPVELILAYFEARGKNTTVLQIGACDGAQNDPVRLHAAKGSARCILLEPNPFAFERLQNTYAGMHNVTLLQAAIAEQHGEAHLYRVRRSGKTREEVDLTLQIASFYKKHLEKHGTRPEDIERITVPSRSLSSVLAEFGVMKLDLLQIDAEGFDAAVVRMALDLPVLPDVINFEHIHLRNADRQPLFDLLARRKYLLGYDQMNLIAVQEALMEEMRSARRMPASSGASTPFPPAS